MENKTKNREWVKTAAIIFLTILLILTFFSNTIMNRTLPEVTTSAVASGTITAKVRGSGTVSAIGSNEVKATGTRSIAAVKVKAGQKVEEGDVLFVMGSAADEEVETAKDTYDDLYYALLRTQASYPINSSAGSYQAAYEAYQQALDNELNAEAQWLIHSDYASNPEYQAAKLKLSELDGKLITARNDLKIHQSNCEKEMNDAQIEYDVAYADWISAPPEEQSAKHDILVKKQYAFEDAVSRYNASFLPNDTYYDIVAGLEAEYSIPYATVLQYESNGGSYFDLYQSAIANRERAESSLASAASSYYSSNASYGQSAALHNVDLQQAQHNLDRQEEKIASLTGEGEDANVYAKVPGIVESVNFSAGDTVVKGDIMCTIEVPDQGYTVSISVTKDQANRLQIGDTADISNYYWGSSIIATVSSIKTDPKNPQSNKLVTFDIEGDVTAGQELKIAIGQKSASYDCIVPNSAVMSDSNGKFVLTVESKQSPLGNRYFARRVDVDVLGSDDINSAVNGNIGNGDFVVTTSSVHINSGDQVRLSDAG